MRTCPGLNAWSSQLNANETETKGALTAYDKEHHPDGEGRGSAIVYRKDPKFDEKGVDDMVQMKQLNDAELANNLRVLPYKHSAKDIDTVTCTDQV